MSIVRSTPQEERGRKDARRHRAKQRKAIKERTREIIADEAIITRKRGKTVKVPIRGIVIPDFRPGTRKKDKGGEGQDGGAGVGQGQGKPGDVIGKRPGQGQQPGGAGEEPGVDYIESEIDLAELIDIMFEDLGLPNLEDKEVAQLETVLGFRIAGIRKEGPHVLLAKRPTAKKGMGRFFAFLQMLQDDSGRDELTCFAALKEGNGNIAVALEILKDPGFTHKETEVEPFPILHNEDLRYHNVQERIEYQSNAVIIAMMDVSGSMSTMKKYLARSMLFWMTELLRKIYDNVEIRFIIHHTNARLVPEEEFFHTGESGGTYCYKAYEMANDLIQTEYPTNMWNVYVFHFSDGDDFRPDETTREVRKLLEDLGINMLGYGEIRVDEGWFGSSNLFPMFEKEFPVEKRVGTAGIEMLVGMDDFPFVGVTIKGKEHILPAITEILKKDRWMGQ